MRWPLELKAKYKVGKLIGQGTNSQVYLVRRLGKNHKRVVKVIKKKPGKTQWQREIDTLVLLKHPNIAKYFEHFETSKRIFIILEYCKGGDLYSAIQREGCISEERSKLWTANLLSALEYCHGNLLVHRDLKPENILISKHGTLKLCDFGFSKQMQLHCKTGTLLGSPGYAAVELYSNSEYNPFLSDIWSLGMVISTMVLGAFPIPGIENNTKLVRDFYSIGLRPELNTTTNVFGKPTSREFRNLIDKLLCPDPEKRLPLDKIKREPWLLGYHVDSCLPHRDAIDVKDQDTHLLTIVSDMTNIGVEKVSKYLQRGSQDHIAFAIYHLILERDADLFERPPHYSAESRTLSGTELLVNKQLTPNYSPPIPQRRRKNRKLNISVL